jgi:hypothetical protein
MPRYWGERIAALVFIAFAFYIAILAQEFPAGGGTFPLFAAGGAVLLSLMIILDTYIRRSAAAEKPIDLRLTYHRLKPLMLTGLSVIYVLAIFRLGYFTASALFLAISTVMIGIRNYKTIALTGVILFPLMYLFFEILLQANLPQGFLI